jgi:hypothetical protein
MPAAARWCAGDARVRLDERREVLVDAATYQPIAERVNEHGTTVNTESQGVPNGSPFERRLAIRVVRYRELPDTPENRRLLELRGGEAQSARGGP